MGKAFWIGSRCDLYLRKNYYFLWEMALILILLIANKSFIVFFRTVLQAQLVLYFFLSPLGILCTALYPGGIQYVLVPMKPVLVTKHGSWRETGTLESGQSVCRSCLCPFWHLAS